MNCDSFIHRLDDHLDGELPAADASALEAHAADCAACRETLLAARRLQRRAFALPAEREPARDLWPGIAARIAARNVRSPQPAWLRAVAASVAVVMIFAGGMLADRVLRESTDTAEPQIAERTPDVARDAARARNILPASYVELIEGDGGLGATDTEQELLRNLLIVNLAIRDIEAAIDANTANADLRRLLAGLYAEENRILAQAQRLRTARQAPTRTSI